MSVLTALRAAWRGPRPAGLAGAEHATAVRLLAEPARAPETPIEHVLVNTLAVTGPLAPAALVSLAARALYRQELAQGGGLVDLGLLGEGLFVPDVTRALEAAHGVLWQIEAERRR